MGLPRTPAVVVDGNPVPVSRSARPSEDLAGVQRDAGAGVFMDGTSMEYLKIRNWARWQSYRSDRGLPPWIKVHRQIIRNFEWISLTDAQKGQLVSIWILAADRDGEIPSDPRMLKVICHMEFEPDLELFKLLGFIESDASVTSECRQGDVKATPTCGMGDASEECQRKVSEGQISCERILSHLNSKTGKNFATTGPRAAASADLIKARLKQGFTEQECIAVIDAKVREWTGTDWAKFLRPSTLFNKTKFEGYVGDIGSSQPALPPLFVEEHVDAQQR